MTTENREPKLNTPEDKEPVSFTIEEYGFIAGIRGQAQANRPEVIELMETKGISFDSGVMKIEVGDQSYELNTDRKSFGTIPLPRLNMPPEEEFEIALNETESGNNNDEEDEEDEENN